MSSVEFFKTKTSALNWINSALETAANIPGDPWHTLVFSYFRQGQIHSKTVVLRAVDLEKGTLEFYTDTRSQKWLSIELNPQISLLFYCPKRLVQLSISGKAKLTSRTPDLEQRFHKMRVLQQQAYTSKLSPGSPFPKDSAPQKKQDDPGLGARFFGIVTVGVEQFDFVTLCESGHQRLTGSDLAKPTDALWLSP